MQNPKRSFLIVLIILIKVVLRLCGAHLRDHARAIAPRELAARQVMFPGGVTHPNP